MKRGTKSILFGVHQFLWHPLTVALAWRRLYRQWPTLYEWIAVFCHDIGYWGKSAMDSDEGQTHPELGARVARRLARWTARLRGRPHFDSYCIGEYVHDLTLFHSTHYAAKQHAEVSRLYLPDKACVLVEPMWFYLLRASLSGELKEYVDNENKKRWLILTPREWLRNYRKRIQEKVDFYREHGRKVIPILYVKDDKLRGHLYRTSSGNRLKCQCDICLEKK